MAGKLWSGKLGRHVDHESALERDYFVLQEFSPEVSRYEEQPLRLPINRPDGAEGSYVPDGLVWYHEIYRRPTLAEVKYAWQLERDRDELAPKLRAGEEYALANGFEWVVATDKEIRTPLLKNAKFLLPFRRNLPDAQFVALALQLAASPTPIAVGQLVSYIADSTESVPAEVLPRLWSLVATFSLRVDLQIPLTMKSLISIPDTRRLP